MLYNQIMRLKIGLWGWKNWPKAGYIAFGASKSAEGGVRGVVWAKKVPSSRHDMSELRWFESVSISVQYLIGGK